MLLNRKTITRIITKSTGYVEVSFEAGFTQKEMALNLTDENGAALKKAPAKREPVKVWQDIGMSVNDKWNRNSTWKLAEQKFGHFDAKGERLYTRKFS